MKRIVFLLLFAGLTFGLFDNAHAVSRYPCRQDIFQTPEWWLQVRTRSDGALTYPEDVVHFTVMVQLNVKQLALEAVDTVSSTQEGQPEWLTQALRDIDESDWSEEEKQSARNQLTQPSGELAAFPDTQTVRVGCAIIDKTLAERSSSGSFRVMGANSRTYNPRFVDGIITTVEVPICIPEADDPRDARSWKCELLINGGWPSENAEKIELKPAPGTPFVKRLTGDILYVAPAFIGFYAPTGSTATSSTDTSSTTIPSAAELQEALPASGPSPTEALTDNATIVGNEIATPTVKDLLPTTDEKSIITDFLNSPAIVGPSQ